MDDETLLQPVVPLLLDGTHHASPAAAHAHDHHAGMGTLMAFDPR